MSTKAAYFLTGLLMLGISPQLVAENQDPRFYFGVGLVTSSLDINENNISTVYAGGDPVSAGSDPIGLDMVFGYRKDRFLSIEMAFTELGPVNATGGGITRKLFDVSSFTLAVSLSKSVSDSISLFAKLGASMWDASSSGFDSLESGTGLLVGAGLDINLYDGKDQQLRIEWRQHDFDEVTLMSADTVSASLVWFF